MGEKQELVTATNYNQFITLLAAKLKDGFMVVPGTMFQWKVNGEEEFPGILTKYVAVVEHPFGGDEAAVAW